MKSFKISLLVFTVMLLSSFTHLIAQEANREQRTPEEIAQKQTSKLTKELALTEDQQKSVYDINLKYAQQNQELRQSLLKTKQQLDKRDKELKATLNDEQKEKFDKLRASQREKFKQARQERENAAQIQQ